MPKLISPCAECPHHLFGLPKDCDKCKDCDKRMLYVASIELGIDSTNLDERTEHALSAYQKATWGVVWQRSPKR